MKRIIIILSALTLTAVPACAIEHETFSIYSEMFGANAIDDSSADAIDDCVMYQQDGCSIIFRHENGKIISALIIGQGDSYLAYCYGAVMQFDPNTNNLDSNGGQLLGCYLMAHQKDNEKHFGTTGSGSVFSIHKENDKFAFLIMDVR